MAPVAGRRTRPARQELPEPDFEEINRLEREAIERGEILIT